MQKNSNKISDFVKIISTMIDKYAIMRILLNKYLIVVGTMHKCYTTA